MIFWCLGEQHHLLRQQHHVLLDLHQPLHDPLIHGVLDLELLGERGAQGTLMVELGEEVAELRDLRDEMAKRGQHSSERVFRQQQQQRVRQRGIDRSVEVPMETDRGDR
jgi:hypothetical protein